MALLINGIDTPAVNFPSMEFELPGGGRTTVEFREYTLPNPSDRHTQNGETPAGQRIRRLREAIHHIVHRISAHAEANRYFRGLPRRRTLTELITERPDIIICFSPANFRVEAASPVVTVPHPPADKMRISLTGLCFHGTRATGRSVEATIIHELAHLNGASGSPSSLAAENSLLHSRMGDRFNPGNTG